MTIVHSVLSRMQTSHATDWPSAEVYENIDAGVLPLYLEPRVKVMRSFLASYLHQKVPKTSGLLQYRDVARDRVWFYIRWRRYIRCFYSGFGGSCLVLVTNRMDEAIDYFLKLMMGLLPVQNCFFETAATLIHGFELWVRVRMPKIELACLVGVDVPSSCASWIL